MVCGVPGARKVTHIIGSIYDLLCSMQCKLWLHFNDATTCIHVILQSAVKYEILCEILGKIPTVYIVGQIYTRDAGVSIRYRRGQTTSWHSPLGRLVG